MGKTARILVAVGIGVFMLAGFGMTTPDVAAGERKIAVAAEGPGEDAQISRRTARTPYILMFDDNGELRETYENPIDRDRQAGPAMAQWLSDNRVDTLIGGGIGRNLQRSLDRLRIRGIEADGSARDAVAAELDLN